MNYSKLGCTIWFVGFAIWIIIGFITYKILSPYNFFSFIGWVVLWQIATAVIDLSITFLLLYVDGKRLIQRAKKEESNN